MKYRLTKAALLLESTDLPVNHIAFSCGYANGLSFSKAFKKMMNTSPSNYRQLKHKKDFPL